MFSRLKEGPPDFVSFSLSGQRNEAFRRLWAAYWVDRVLLGFTLVWVGIRLKNYLMIVQRPDVLYEPTTWLAHLMVQEPMSGIAYYTLLVIVTVSAITCFYKPNLIPARLCLAVAAIFVMIPEFGYGKVDHINHLFLLAHVYAIFLPTEKPSASSNLIDKAEAATWYQFGLLMPYTFVGLWKVAEMTIRDFIKPGMTWLHPDALIITSLSAMRNSDLPLDIPMYLDAIKWVFPIGYVVVSLIFCVSFLGAFRRPLLLILLPAFLSFHLLNVTHYVLFLSTCVVATILFLPLEILFSNIDDLEPVTSTKFSGQGADARYERTYANGDIDQYKGFYAYREHLSERSRLLSALLFFPGVSRVAAWILPTKSLS